MLEPPSAKALEDLDDPLVLQFGELSGAVTDPVVAFYDLRDPCTFRPAIGFHVCRELTGSESSSFDKAFPLQHPEKLSVESHRALPTATPKPPSPEWALAQRDQQAHRRPNQREHQQPGPPQARDERARSSVRNSLHPSHQFESPPPEQIGPPPGDRDHAELIGEVVGDDVAIPAHRNRIKVSPEAGQQLIFF